MNTQTTVTRKYYPALRGLFGDWIYYCCLMSVGDVTKRVRFADEVHKSTKLSEMIQRALKGGRAKEISDYLQREKERFFNSLVVGIYGGDPEWHAFSRFRRVSADIDLEEVSEDTENSLGLLSFAGTEQIFALDGQHRLAGMKEAIKTMREFTKDEVSLLVVAHKTTKAGTERTRRLFTTLNKTARPVGKGEIIALDENDVMAIVTRYLVEEDARFEDDKVKFTQAENLPANAPELTTIGNLYDVLTALFTRCFEGAHLSTLRYIRPPDKDLAAYIHLAQTFFSELEAHFRPMKSYLQASGDQAPKIVAEQRTQDGGHVLFRPVGLRIVAEIVGEIVKNEKSTVSDALKLVAKLPIELSERPYRDVLWRNGKMNVSGRVLCRRLLLHMLKREPRPSKLRERYAQFLGVEKHQVRLPSPVI